MNRHDSVTYRRAHERFEAVARRIDREVTDMLDVLEDERMAFEYEAREQGLRMRAECRWSDDD